MNKTYLILILIFTNFLLGYSQDQALKEVCNCYTNLDYSLPIERITRQIEKCTKDRVQYYQDDFDSLFKSSANSLIFLKQLGSDCPDFVEFTSKYGLDDKEISDLERIEKIDYLASCFSYPIKKGKKAKKYWITPTEKGVLYNSYFRRIYPDSIFGYGTYTLPFYDSLIIFDLLPKKYTSSLKLKLADNSEPKLDLTFVIALKEDKIGHLIKEYSASYDKFLLMPGVNISTRKALENLSISDLYKLQQEDISAKIVEETLKTDDFNKYLTLVKVYVDHIDYPAILDAAINANLVQEYNDLKEMDSEIRLKAIDRLFTDSSETAYLIILNHWRFENDNTVKNYILEKLSSNNN